MTFIDTQPRPLRFTTIRDRGSNDYIITCCATGHVVRRDTLEEANDYIASELSIMHTKPSKLPTPEYGFGRSGISRNYYESRKRTTPGA